MQRVCYAVACYEGHVRVNVAYMYATSTCTRIRVLPSLEEYARENLPICGSLPPPLLHRGYCRLECAALHARAHQRFSAFLFLFFLRVERIRKREKLEYTRIFLSSLIRFLFFDPEFLCAVLQTGGVRMQQHRGEVRI